MMKYLPIFVVLFILNEVQSAPIGDEDFTVKQGYYKL